jgi:hypothetical protein
MTHRVVVSRGYDCLIVTVDRVNFWRVKGENVTPRRAVREVVYAIHGRSCMIDQLPNGHYAVTL